MVAVTFEEGAGVEGGGLPVFIDGWNLHAGVGIAPDQGRDLPLVEPLLDLRRALVKDPGIGIGFPDQAFEFASGIFEPEEPGGKELQGVVTLIEEFAEGVKLDQHPRWKLGEGLRGKKGDPLG
jgi:hypothetical protein